jgi:hypothetical protein
VNLCGTRFAPATATGFPTVNNLIAIYGIPDVALPCHGSKIIK